MRKQMLGLALLALVASPLLWANHSTPSYGCASGCQSAQIPYDYSPPPYATYYPYYRPYRRFSLVVSFGGGSFGMYRVYPLRPVYQPMSGITIIRSGGIRYY